MKVLVATAETQGKRKGDFCFVPEGELVNTGGFECDGESIDGSCGCRRSFVGLKTHKAMTTAKVVELQCTQDDLWRWVRESLIGSGWVKAGEDDELVREEANAILRVAAVFETGMVIEKRGTKIQERPNGG
jgi:hypothetical protein